VDTWASMSVMAVSVVRESGIMHLVTSTESYKIKAVTKFPILMLFTNVHAFLQLIRYYKNYVKDIPK
jgi:hypothetical protein